LSRNDIWLTGPLQVNPYPDCNNGIILDFINQGAFYMARIFNFSAGPAVLPEPVLKKAASVRNVRHGDEPPFKGFRGYPS
jgi:hypothetical protein